MGVFALGGTVLAADPNQIQLTGTVRDFRGAGTTSQIDNTVQEHPDFESDDALIWSLQAPFGLGHDLQVDPNLVKNQLGADRKPVFNQAGGTLTTADNFNKWYNDDGSFNRGAPLTLTLTETSPGVFTYDNQNFFPIDDQLLGNTVGGRIVALNPFGGGIVTVETVPPDHNWHFTYELHTSFTYQTGQFFNFTGDDDLWVFINGQLAVDRGGVNRAISVGADLDTLGLTPGQTYDFDLFFAERHTKASTVRFETSIASLGEAVEPPTPGIPEPASGLIALAGLGGLALLRRR